MPTNDQIKAMIERLESPMLKVQREVAGTGYLLGEAIHVHCDTDRLAASVMLRELLAEREATDNAKIIAQQANKASRKHWPCNQPTPETSK